MNRYFFYILIAISFPFAGISSAISLRKNELLSRAGAAMAFSSVSVVSNSLLMNRCRKPKI